MSTSKHTESEVLIQLRNKQDVKVTPNKEVLVLRGRTPRGQSQQRNDLGNSSWGKIDFLVNHCGYVRIFVAEW